MFQRIARAESLLAPAFALTVLLALAACATPAPVPKVVGAPPLQAIAAAQLQLAPSKTYKRKIAIGRFTNETRYGKALLTGDEVDPLGRQVSDMLGARLTESGRFLVFERPDIGVVKAEQAISGGSIVGVDTLIVGSLTEFGREIEGETGFLSATKKQVARAKVELRLVEVKTGRVFFSASGSGEASVENGNVMGFGNQAGYDATLNDRAIGAAISDVMNTLVTKLEERPWRSDVLKVAGNQVYVTGGERQGVKPGDRLLVMQAGETVRSGQSGMDIDLPPTQIAELAVNSTFGTDETNEGAICRIVSGSIPAQHDRVFVVDGRVS